MSQDPTTFEAWSDRYTGGPTHPTIASCGKVKKSVTDVSVMSLDMLLIAFHFSPLNQKWESNIEHCNLNSCDFESIFINSLSHKDT